MSELVAIAFDNEHAAFDARAKFSRMQGDYVIEMDDVVVVTRNAKGKVKLHQAVNLPLSGATGGAFWGLLIGLLLLNPLLGAAIGAGLGAISGALSDIGIDDAFMKRLGEQLKPDSSALFVLLRKATFDRMADNLRDLDGTILHTSLSRDSEDELREVVEKHEIGKEDVLTVT